MTIPVFIGDEVTASAWRLIGARTIIVDDDDVAGVFDRALAGAELVLITAPCAATLEGDRLDKAVRRARPLVLVVPDAAGRLAPPDLDVAIDRVLGIEQ